MSEDLFGQLLDELRGFLTPYEFNRIFWDGYEGDDDITILINTKWFEEKGLKKHDVPILDNRPDYTDGTQC